MTQQSTSPVENVVCFLINMLHEQGPSGKHLHSAETPRWWSSQAVNSHTYQFGPTRLHPLTSTQLEQTIPCYVSVCRVDRGTSQTRTSRSYFRKRPVSPNQATDLQPTPLPHSQKRLRKSDTSDRKDRSARTEKRACRCGGLRAPKRSR
jgi:hypothetical protein